VTPREKKGPSPTRGRLFRPQPVTTLRISRPKTTSTTKRQRDQLSADYDQTAEGRQRETTTTQAALSDAKTNHAKGRRPIRPTKTPKSRPALARRQKKKIPQKTTEGKGLRLAESGV